MRGRRGMAGFGASGHPVMIGAGKNRRLCKQLFLLMILSINWENNSTPVTLVFGLKTIAVFCGTDVLH